MSLEKFKVEVSKSFDFEGKFIELGGAVYNGTPQANLQVKLPLSMVNRHGLIAGATGAGKTKTVQRIAESLSEQGVNVLLMDIKGDVSGICKPGNPHPKITERMSQIGSLWEPMGFPAELMTISDEKGVRLRATVSEFGPVLFSKILELNDNQQGAVAIIFKYCDDNQLPLLDIKDFRAALQHLSEGEGQKEIAKNYGAISSASAGVIMRKLLELELQGGDKFFGEVSFEVEDLLQKDASGKAYINILRLVDIQDRPKLFSTFMLCLLAEIYAKFPESGDKGEPKLVIVIDEAHLIFKEASDALLSQLETIIKLIRSKGVGVFFCTQAPTDVPDSILSQLGTKIQHALRAFTAKDRKAIKLVAENFPLSEFYKTDQLITELGIGEAIVTVLNEKGIPSMLVHTLLSAPKSRMDILTDAEQEEVLRKSPLAAEYNVDIDRESAYEILTEKLKAAQAEPEAEQSNGKQNMEEEGSGIGSTLKSIAGSSVTKSIIREVARGFLGVLFGKTTTRRRRRAKSLF